MMIDDVRAAQCGDRAAFGRLVRDLGPMALRVARGWLKDEAAAEDAAQDAFLDAYRQLAELREPKAFPAWLLRIVRKHCDRRTRRRSDEPLPTLAAETDNDRLEASEALWALADGLGRLPEHERIVLALHYLGEQSVREVAEMLALSPDAVKQRLRRGRDRLAETIARKLEQPAPAEALEDRVQLFLAIRTEDHDLVRVRLDRRPDLIEARESWSDATALAAGMTIAHQLTPLLTAAGRGDLAMTNLLLQRGAAVDGRCGCEGGETPLFAAAIRGHAAVVERLLRAGADPEAKGKRPSPLQVALRRGHDGVVRILTSRTGARSAGRLEPAAPLGFRIAPEGLWTGIAALDLLAPLVPGQRVRVLGPAETGLTVLLAELSLRASLAGWWVRWVTWPSSAWQRDEYAQVALRYGLHDRVEVTSEPKTQPGPGLLVLLPGDGREAEAEAALAQPVPGGGLLLSVSPWEKVTRGAPATPLAAPFDARVATDPALAAEGIYPALHSR